MKTTSIARVYRNNKSIKRDFGSLDQNAGSPSKNPQTMTNEYGVKTAAYFRFACFCGSGEKKRTEPTKTKKH